MIDIVKVAYICGVTSVLLAPLVSRASEVDENLLQTMNYVVSAKELHDGKHEDLSFLLASNTSSDDDDAEDGENEDEHEEESNTTAELSEEQIRLADIKVIELKPRIVDYQIQAPGEIKSNGYTSYRVSARIPSIVIRRHVALGDTVQPEQALVTLFSEEAAEAQADYRSAISEWQRVKTLGRQAVGEKRFISAQGDVETSVGKLEAYGSIAADIQALESNAKVKLGEYVLRATSRGVVISDDFHQGQRVKAGQTIMDLVDETELWVEARLPPGTALSIPVGTDARVEADGYSFNAKVVQKAHTIDYRTRTHVVRLVVDNRDKRLYPGSFANVKFHFNTDNPVLALPETAVLRSAEGRWQIFIETAQGHFEAKEVNVIQMLGDKWVITGAEIGSRVVTQGAFAVYSEIAKSGFATDDD